MATVELVRMHQTPTLLLLIGRFVAGRKRIMNFPEDVTSDRMSMYTIYCQPMRYLNGDEYPIYTTTPELPTRTAGKHAFYPANEQDGYYLTSYLQGNLRMTADRSGWQAFDLPSPQGKKVQLATGDTYVVPAGHVILLAGGELSVTPSQSTPTVAPAIIDGTAGDVSITAVTDVTFAEVWA